MGEYAEYLRNVERGFVMPTGRLLRGAANKIDDLEIDIERLRAALVKIMADAEITLLEPGPEEPSPTPDAPD